MTRKQRKKRKKKARKKQQLSVWQPSTRYKVLPKESLIPVVVKPEPKSRWQRVLEKLPVLRRFVLPPK